MFPLWSQNSLYLKDMSNKTKEMTGSGKIINKSIIFLSHNVK